MWKQLATLGIAFLSLNYGMCHAQPQPTAVVLAAGGTARMPIVIGEQAGDIVEIETGRVLGQHNGYWFHTIGQRQGLGLGNGPWFVVRKDIKENRLYVSHRENLTNHIRSAFEVGDVHWISEPPKRSELQIKIRHAPECFACTIQACPDGKLAVNMAAAETGIAAGQFAVFYDGDTCLGGGKIVR